MWPRVSTGSQLVFLLDSEINQSFTNPLVFSGNVGLGYEFKNGFLIDTRFNFGISSFIDEDVDFLPDIPGKNSFSGETLVFMFGDDYKF